MKSSVIQYIFLQQAREMPGMISLWERHTAVELRY